MGSSLKSSAEQGSSNTSTLAEGAQTVVFQPHKLTEIVEMIDLMGKISTRAAEDRSQDMGSGAQTGGAQQAGTGQQSARDLAIANLPAAEQMQQKLVKHIRSEMRTLNSQARAAARSNATGSAYLLNELYRKIRRLSGLIEELLQASIEVIKRFYIAVFIDNQPLIVTAGKMAR